MKDGAAPTAGQGTGQHAIRRERGAVTVGGEGRKVIIRVPARMGEEDIVAVAADGVLGQVPLP